MAMERTTLTRLRKTAGIAAMDAGLAAVVRQESQGAVRLLLLAERPVNALGPALRRDLMAALVAVILLARQRRQAVSQPAPRVCLSSAPRMVQAVRPDHPWQAVARKFPVASWRCRNAAVHYRRSLAERQPPAGPV